MTDQINDMDPVANQEAVLDFSEVEDRSFEPLPRGKYDVRVIEAEFKQGGKGPYLAISYVVEAEEESPYNGRRLWDNMSFSPKALWKVKSFLLAAGMTPEELKGPLSLVPEDLMDAVLTCGVSTEKGQDDEPRNVVKRYYKAVGYDVTEDDTAVAATVADEEVAS